MIVVKLMGGLGNQMFQYALGRHLALKHRTELKLDARFLLDRTPRDNFVYREYDLTVFGIEHVLATREDLERFPHIKYPFLYRHLLSHIPYWNCHVRREKDFRFDPRILQAPNDSYLDGYWQNELYFKEIEGVIRRDFTVKEPADRELSDSIAGSNAVCVNVRRGDYVTHPGSRKMHGFVGLEYYQKAVQSITGKVADPAFFVFSDDIEWCREHLSLPPAATFVTHQYAGKKFGAYFKLMTLCRHFIIPNSSFGWWAAWMCENPEKIVVAPTQWFQDPVLNKQMRGIIPPRWTRVETDQNSIRKQCNLCGSSNYKEIFRKNTYIIVQCNHCKLIFVENVPPEDSIKKLYTFESGYHREFTQNLPLIRNHNKFYTHYYALLRKYKNPGTLLDIGCSTGFFIDVAKKNGWIVRGIEISHDSAKIAQEIHNKDVYEGMLQEGLYPEETFDAITLWDVLEHVPDPKQLLMIVYTLLKKDGLVFIRTPNVDGLFPRISFYFSKYLNYWPHPEPPYHLYQFSPSTLRNYLNNSGFEVVDFTSQHIQLGYVFGDLSSLVKNPKKLLYSIVFVPVSLFGQSIHRGDTMVIVAKKIPHLDQIEVS
jgi:2-polyprenyl-3-methyl-5-hydroxy-6-metoxy-1,4-benzoquinol methylase